MPDPYIDITLNPALMRGVPASQEELEKSYNDGKPYFIRKLARPFYSQTAGNKSAVLPNDLFEVIAEAEVYGGVTQRHLGTSSRFGVPESGDRRRTVDLATYDEQLSREIAQGTALLTPQRRPSPTKDLSSSFPRAGSQHHSTSYTALHNTYKSENKTKLSRILSKTVGAFPAHNSPSKRTSTATTTTDTKPAVYDTGTGGADDSSDDEVDDRIYVSATGI